MRRTSGAVSRGVVAAAVAVAWLSAACTSSTNAVATTTSRTIATATTASPITVPPATVVSPASTTSADSTTTLATASSSSTSAAATTTNPSTAPQLRLGGIGGAAFGDPVTTVLPMLIGALGATASDDQRSYPTLQSDGTYLTADGEFGYVAPKGREVCWHIGWCADFGGSSDAAMAFTGWSYGGDSTKALRSKSGVSIGTRWSEVPRISMGPGLCNGLAPATVDGITLKLESRGVPFAQQPKHDDVLVMTMTSGEVPQFQFDDC
ncbi:MAG: hypothetical protein WCI22_11840 [Actinomycetota bacterium]